MEREMNALITQKGGGFPKEPYLLTFILKSIPKIRNLRYNSSKGFLLCLFIVYPLGMIFLVARTTRTFIISKINLLFRILKCESISLFTTLLRIPHKLAFLRNIFKISLIAIPLTFCACSSKVQTNKIPQVNKYHLPNTSTPLKTSVDSTTKAEFDKALRDFFKIKNVENDFNIYKVGIERGHFR